MGTRGGTGRSRKQQEEMMRWCQQQQQQQQQTLTPLMEGPHESDHQQLEMQLHDLLLVGNKKEISSWEVVREWFRLHKNNMASPAGSGGGGSSIPASKRQDLRLLLGVLGCPLAPIPLHLLLHDLPPPPSTNNIKETPTLLPNNNNNNNHPLLTQLPLHHIHHLPIESSTAHYIIQQYLAATGCLKKQQLITSSNNNSKLCSTSSSSSRKNMYTAGTVRMICCETEISCGKSVKTVGSRSGEKGCFVLWQMYPGMWSLELVVAGHKVLAGSDGKIVWRHTPWLGTHAAKGPQRPLRRIIQGLDPRSTGRLFGRAECMGEKRIGNEDCFVLKVAADRADVMERNDGPAEVIRHVLYGYFSQKSGLLIYMEDSHLTRVIQYSHDHHHHDHDTDHHHHVYWETTIGSSIGDYKDVDGLLIAHQGRTIATVFRFGEMSTQHTRTRMEEHWSIDDVVFDVPGLDIHSFIPPADIFHHSP